MPAIPRLDLAHIPNHIIQRGVNRAPCFVHNANYWKYLDELKLAAKQAGCRIHAYVLMTNHVHLLVTPHRAGAIGQLMQHLGRQYVGQFNARHRRTGTLWEGRYKACLVDTTEYLLRCVRYIDLNPVRARMTDDPTAFAWSSCPGLCGLRDDPLLAPHPAQRALGADGYRALLAEALSEDDLAALRLYLQQQRAYGRDAFRAMVEAKTQRFAGVRPAHRPAKTKSITETG